jgi:hypothetical protein
LDPIFDDSRADGLQTLIGIQSPSLGLGLFRTDERIVNSETFGSIGCGDSSVLRFLDDIWEPMFPLSIFEAQVIASYLVSVASRYIDGCGGGPDSASIYADGNVTQGTGGVFPNEKARFNHCEKEIGRALRELLLSGGTKVVAMQPIPQKLKDQ